jgi:long-chain acyl-CoA synthetase
MEILVRLLERTDRNVIALVRAADDTAAEARIDQLLSLLIAPDRRGRFRARVKGVAGRLEGPGLGLSESMRDQITRSIGTVVHCAASLSYTMELAKARPINVGGTREVLSLAREARDHGSLDRVVHVSTAYVAGKRSGRVHEDEADVGQPLRNTYERTKLEAEHVVRESDLPAAILRPSIIYGDSVTGWTPAFSAIYQPLRALSRGLLAEMPADPDGRLDIVPVNVVADAMLELLCGPVRCGTFQVVAGDEARSVQRLMTMAALFFEVPVPRFIRPGGAPSAAHRVGVVAPYLDMHCVFDGRRARDELGARPPPVEQYFPQVLQYARAARWGKDGLARWAACAVDNPRAAVSQHG